MEPSQIIETHISVLVFYGDRVYKVRKPVSTPFLDFTTRELRLADCRREVALNRRLAADVYLGVHDVVDEDGAPVEHLVVMRRLPADRRLATLIGDPALGSSEVVAVARLLAAFHAGAERSEAIDRAGGVEHLTMLWSTNIAETTPFAGTYLDGEQLAEIGRRALRYLEGRHQLFAERVAAGRTVDGHGDLLAEDIFCLDDGPRILDCIEFDARFRYGDVLYDTAFLAMDLEHRGRDDLARQFLAAYREFADERHPTSLEHWYIAYRALVRAKIACLRGEAGTAGAPAEAASLLHLASHHLEEAEVRLVLVGGLPGTGKSTLADGLADRFGWVVLHSDEVRKDLAGMAHGESAAAEPFGGIYDPAFSAGVYRELLRRARVALSRGESVVIDATWLDPQRRAEARELAGQQSASLFELSCEVGLDAAAARIRTRRAAGGDASDATLTVLARLATVRSGAPWPEAQVLHTASGPSATLERAVEVVRPDRQY